MTWITITIFAALAQTLRFGTQRHLRLSTLSSAGATYARFVYAGPLIVAVALGYWAFLGMPDITYSPQFGIYIVIGGATQILATMCLITLFTLRHFTVGITLSYTQVLFTAGFGILILGDWITLCALGAMLLGILGVILLSKHTGGLQFTQGMMFNRATTLGLLAGLFFGICAVMFRGAAQEIRLDDAFLRASQALMWAILVQTLILTVYLRINEPGQILAVLRAWRTAIWVGVLSLAGSIGWFTAFALQNAAYVKALGQVEVLFSLAVSYFVFNERLSKREGWGILCLILSVTLLVVVI